MSQLTGQDYRWARHCSATCHFTVAKITQSDAFNYMSYHFLCKRGIRPARTEQFLVLTYFFSLKLSDTMQCIWSRKFLRQHVYKTGSISTARHDRSLNTVGFRRCTTTKFIFFSFLLQLLGSQINKPCS